MTKFVLEAHFSHLDGSNEIPEYTIFDLITAHNISASLCYSYSSRKGGFCSDKSINTFLYLHENMLGVSFRSFNEYPKLSFSGKVKKIYICPGWFTSYLEL